MPSQQHIRITQTILEALKSGNLPPWRKPWVGRANTGLPTNIISNKRYRGINVLLLQLHQMRFGFSSKFYGTLKQWNSIAGRIRPRPSNVPPGQWGCQCVFYKPITKIERNDKGEEVEVQYPLLRTFTVFLNRAGLWLASGPLPSYGAISKSWFHRLRTCRKRHHSNRGRRSARWRPRMLPPSFGNGSTIPTTTGLSPSPPGQSLGLPPSRWTKWSMC